MERSTRAGARAVVIGYSAFDASLSCHRTRTVWGGSGASIEKPSCLRTFFSQLEQPEGHRGGSNGSPCETRDHGGMIVSSVKAVLELSEVAGHMLLIDRSIGSG